MKNHNLRPERTPTTEAFSFSLKDAARLSSLSVPTLRRREREGHFKFHKLGRRTLVRRADLLRLCGAEV